MAVALIMGGLMMASAAPLDVPFSGMPHVRLSFETSAGQPVWTQEKLAKDEARYSWQGYSLRLRLAKNGAQQVLGFELTPPDGKTLSVRSYSAEVTLPAKRLHAVTVPSANRLARTVDYYAEQNKWPNVPVFNTLVKDGFKDNLWSNGEAPLIVMTDEQGKNGATVGWSAASISTFVESRVAGGNCILSLKRREDLAFCGASLKDALVLDTSDRPWMEAEEAYARAFDTYNGRKHEAPPAWAYEPVYCTWYCYTDHIDQAGVLKIARKCKELGFGTILIDAGWDSNPDGGYIDWESGVLGDYEARKERFPDMPGLVKQIHDMGLRVELWCAPFWEGKKSKAYQGLTKEWHMQVPGGEAHELCPKYPQTREHFRERFAWIAKTYGIDGMWLDGADAVQGECTASHAHLDQQMGLAFADCLSAAREGLRSVRPDAVLEARVLHANLNTKRAFDVIQPSDAPGSYEVLRMADIHIRPWAYDVVVKNDPMIWAEDADDATIGKFLATMVCNGVPALSVDFLTAPERQCAITKAWLGFYRVHQEALSKGKFSLFGADPASPDMMIVAKDEAVVYLKNSKTVEIPLPHPVKRLILLNCTDSDSLSLKVSPACGKLRMASFHPNWSRSNAGMVLDMDAMTSLVIPQGGGAVLE